MIVAGETCEGLGGALSALRRKYPPPTEVFVVSGNHEFFSGTPWSEELDAGRQAALKLGIHFLENDTITIDRLRVIGATLWTDYELLGTALCESAMLTAQRTMIDHSRMVAGLHIPTCIEIIDFFLKLTEQVRGLFMIAQLNAVSVFPQM